MKRLSVLLLMLQQASTINGQYASAPTTFIANTAPATEPAVDINNIASISASSSETIATTTSTITISTNSHALDNCPLLCKNNGKCEKGGTNTTLAHPVVFDENGLPRSSIHATLPHTTDTSWQCACPEGYTGLMCEKQYKSCTIVEQYDHPGTHVCYHGGECIDGLDQIHNTAHMYCNCKPQADEDTGAVHYYSGKYCEHEVRVVTGQSTINNAQPVNGKLATVSTASGAYPTDTTDTITAQEKAKIKADTAVCESSNDSFSGAVYCLNGGTCADPSEKDQGSGTRGSWSPVQPCHCPSGFSGRHCEFQVGSVPNCDLQCLNGGRCRLGMKLDLDQQPTDHQDQYASYQHCQCPKGFSGNRCEVSTSKCGEEGLYCMHGASCLAVNGKNHCDCNSIPPVRNSTSTEVKRYAGKKCDVESTSICAFDDKPSPSSDPNGGHKLKRVMFCANGGTCPSKPHMPCTCPKGYGGPHCEYTDAELKTMGYGGSCLLNCQNGGTCRFGANYDQKTYSTSTENQQDELSHMKDLNTMHSEDFQHCACPDGYTGLECQYKVDECDGGTDYKNSTIDHPCFHDSTCHIVKGKPVCMCDGNVAGKYCQHKANDVCIPKKEYSGGLQGTASSANNNPNKGFCVNGGQCIHTSAGLSTCMCHPGFEGPHCEYSTESGIPTTTQPEDTSSQSSQGLEPNTEAEAAYKAASMAEIQEEMKEELSLIGIFIGVVIAILFVGVFIWFLCNRHHNSIEKLHSHKQFVDDPNDIDDPDAVLPYGGDQNPYSDYNSNIDDLQLDNQPKALMTSFSGDLDDVALSPKSGNGEAVDGGASGVYA